MWRIRVVLAIVCGFGCLLAVGVATAPAQIMVGTGGIGFRNELPGPVVVRGVTIDKRKGVTAGPPIRIPPGKVGWDNGLTPGIRVITVVDANQPNIVLIREEPIPFQGRDMAFLIVLENGKVQLKRPQR
jgi:hypothetical protein